MKTNIIVILIGLAIAIAACSKDNKEEIPENPKWLNDKILYMDTAIYYHGTVVTLYKWTNQYYYLLSIPLSSCIMCDFYDYQGVKFIWTSDKIEDFQKNAIKIKDVWTQRD
jgi:hypothetical protein